MTQQKENSELQSNTNNFFAAVIWTLNFPIVLFWVTIKFLTIVSKLVIELYGPMPLRLWHSIKKENT
jgi:hypothetical protein